MSEAAHASYWSPGVPREIVSHPQRQGLRRWTLITRDAHALYARDGFTPPATPDRFMERRPLQ